MKYFFAPRLKTTLPNIHSPVDGGNVLNNIIKTNFFDTTMLEDLLDDSNAIIWKNGPYSILPRRMVIQFTSIKCLHIWNAFLFLHIPGIRVVK